MIGIKSKLTIRIGLVKESQKVAVGFDFNNPQKMIADLAKKLMALK